MAPIRKVAIVGGGLAGLAAGGLLSRKGVQVSLFEANNKLGGCCATTTVDGYTFNDGALFVAVPSLLDFVFEQLGLSRQLFVPLRKITALQTTRLADGTVVRFGEGLDVSVTRPDGQVEARVARDQLEVLLRKWEPVLHLFIDDLVRHPLSIRRLVLKGWRQLPKLRGTLAAELDTAFTDPAIRAALSAAVLFSGVPSRQTPVASILGLIALFTEGLYLPEGGMGRIPAALSDSLAGRGGDIVLNADVRRIVLANGRARGIDVAGHGIIEADAEISTANAMSTFTWLLDPAEAPREAVRKVQRARLSHRAVAVQLGLSNDVTGTSYFNCVVPFMDDQDQVFVARAQEIDWPIYYVSTLVMPELAPPGGSVIEAFPPVDQHQSVELWDEQQEANVLDLVTRSLSRMHDCTSSRIECYRRGTIVTECTCTTVPSTVFRRWSVRRPCSRTGPRLGVCTWRARRHSPATVLRRRQSRVCSRPRPS